MFTKPIHKAYARASVWASVRVSVRVNVQVNMDCKANTIPLPYIKSLREKDAD